MKGREVPPALVWGVLLLLVIGIGGAYFMQNRPPPQVDMTTISPQRLEDPDMRGK